MAPTKPRVASRGATMGFLHVDGHVRAYGGRQALPKDQLALLRIAAGGARPSSRRSARTASMSWPSCTAPKLKTVAGTGSDAAGEAVADSNVLVVAPELISESLGNPRTASCNESGLDTGSDVAVQVPMQSARGEGRGAERRPPPHPHGNRGTRVPSLPSERGRGTTRNAWEPSGTYRRVTQRPAYTSAPRIAASVSRR